MWLMSVGATVGEAVVIALLIIYGGNYTAFLVVDGAVLVAAMWLMLSASYPENFNTSVFYRAAEFPEPGTPRRDSNNRPSWHLGKMVDGAGTHGV